MMMLYESHLLNRVEIELEKHEKHLQVTFMNDVEEHKSGNEWTSLTQKNDDQRRDKNEKILKTKWDKTVFDRLDECKYPISFRDGLFSHWLHTHLHPVTIHIYCIHPQISKNLAIFTIGAHLLAKHIDSRVQIVEICFQLSISFINYFNKIHETCVVNNRVICIR